LTSVDHLDHMYYTVSLVKGQVISTKKASIIKHHEKISSNTSAECIECCSVGTKPKENVRSSPEREVNESKGLRTNADELVDKGHRVFECEHCGKILMSRGNMR